MRAEQIDRLITLEHTDTKICDRKKCKHQGEPQPLGRFKSRSNFQVFTKNCVDCRDLYMERTDRRYAETDAVNANLQTLLQRKWGVL